METYKAPYPHCDMNVLHAPGKCVFCDDYPAAQNNRLVDGVNFTGDGPDPATEIRPLEVIEHWYGNVPKTQADLDADDKAWNEFWDNLDNDE